MSAHTPGPWSLTENTKRTLNGSWFEINGQMTRIAGVPASTNAMWDFVPGYQTGAANARLIAAAPDLLAALVAVVNDEADSGEGISPAVFKKVMAAIAKAADESKPSTSSAPPAHTLEITLTIGDQTITQELQFIKNFSDPETAVRKISAEMWHQLARATGSAQ